MTPVIAHFDRDFYSLRNLFMAVLVVPVIIAVAVFRRCLDRRKP